MAPAPATAPAGASSEVDAKLQALVARFEMVREFDRYASRRMTQMAPAPAPEPVPAPAPAPEPVPEPAPAPVPAPLPPPVPAPDPLDEELPPPETPRSHGRTLLHSVIAAVLLLLLAGQILHHFRSALLAHPQTRDSVLTVYGGLGLDPALQDDPKLYIVKQLGALAKPDSPRILLRTSIHNPADHPLPLPVLRTRLTDRFGAVLVQADVAPREYLGGRQGNALAPDQRLDTLLDLPDPGPAATSFEVDACLPGATGRLHCANSTGR